MTSLINLPSKHHKLDYILSSARHFFSIKQLFQTSKISPVFILLLLALFVPTLSFAAAQITATVDRNPVSLEDSFELTFTANKTPDDDPDFAPLDQDFTILGKSQSSNLSFINGKSSRSITWTLVVIPKHPGNITIPPIKFGKDTSQPLEITVSQQAANKNIDTDQELFLEVEASPETPFIQAQVLYTVRLYRKVDIAQASLTDPELADAVIEKLGEDSNYNTQVNGVGYLVTERKYAIFPQKSGSLTIKPLVLTAQIASNTRSRFNGFFNPQIAKTKRIESKAITLEVKVEPSVFTGKHWLPAEQLELSQEWSEDFQQIKVGEPITRTLKVRAKGSTIGAVSEINALTSDEKIKVYPDQPTLKEEKTADGVIALREEKVAIIPSQAGNITLPAIELPWFNTQSGKMEIAKIPETTITAISAPGTEVISTPPQLSQENTVSEQPNRSIGTPEVSIQQNSLWMWISLFLGLGWLVTFLYFINARNRPKLQPTTDNIKHDRLDDSSKRLKAACTNNDAQAAKSALLDWGRHKFNASSLGDIADQSDARLRDEILTLNQVIYGKETLPWEGKKLFQAFTENKARTQLASRNEDGLEPLYRL